MENQVLSYAIENFITGIQVVTFITLLLGAFGIMVAKVEEVNTTIPKWIAIISAIIFISSIFPGSYFSAYNRAIYGRGENKQQRIHLDENTIQMLKEVKR